LQEVGEAAAQFTASLRRPIYVIRVSAWLLIGLIIVLALAQFALLEDLSLSFESVGDLMEAIEAALSELVLLGVAVLFLATGENRIKRHRSLKALRELRSIAHVVDMHQLTKDPKDLLAGEPGEPEEGMEVMDRKDLAHCLDYCSEILSLTSKLAAHSAPRSLGFSFLALLPLLCVGCGQETREPPPMETERDEAEGPPFLLTLTDVGFATPESALHDSEADLYLVANINGPAGEKDGNGFISRIRPDGEMLELKWVDGATPGVSLHAPKGMAIVADTLFVTDIDCIRRFHRVSGEPLQDLCLEEAAFLNDLSANRRGDLYFSDSGTSDSPGAVYFLRQTADVPQKVALADGTVLEGEELGGPNGLFADRRGLYVTTYRSGEIFHVTPEGERLDMVGPSEMGLDGFVSLEERGFLFSSWGDQAVYWIQAGGTISVLIEDVESPADMGFDAGRNRVLVPLFLSNRLLIREVR
jgi:hypothetical protein